MFRRTHTWFMGALCLVLAACAGPSGDLTIAPGQARFFEDVESGNIEFLDAASGQVWMIDHGERGVMGTTIADFDGKILGSPSIVSYIGDPRGKHLILNELEGGTTGPLTMEIGANWFWSHKVGTRDGAGNPVLWEWDNVWHIEHFNHQTREIWIYRKAPGFEDTHKTLEPDAEPPEAGDYTGFEIRNLSNAPVRLTLGFEVPPTEARKRADAMAATVK
ncbi:MAG: hypothetical protein HOL07_11140 [Rhodospirillaceae bacterium]|jgi:hypothetical protein|nr:hypothetical protein [Rhodospirillaceae bacterium]MBT3809077.1 hypothetical protein [Rhodospirillaceae bacterium]MBT3931672.1 hypothetical protein [Rhodospirillaceae bacterium]MBT4773660.1 hypothetical protein [Rhodospirillaceae bacterium]MBT5358889.1 hypothetical protein [Rhodospirillaceae bacterium]